MAEGILCAGAGTHVRPCPYQARYRVHQVDKVFVVVGPTRIHPRYCKRHANETAEFNRKRLAEKAK